MLAKLTLPSNLHRYFNISLFYSFDQLHKGLYVYYDKVDAISGLSSSQKLEFKALGEHGCNLLNTPRKRAAYQANQLANIFDDAYEYSLFDFLNVSSKHGFADAFHSNGLEIIPPLDVYLNTSSKSLDELAIAFSETAKGIYERSPAAGAKLKHLALTYQIVSSPDLHALYLDYE